MVDHRPSKTPFASEVSPVFMKYCRMGGSLFWIVEQTNIFCYFEIIVV